MILRHTLLPLCAATLAASGCPDSSGTSDATAVASQTTAGSGTSTGGAPTTGDDTTGGTPTTGTPTTGGMTTTGSTGEPVSTGTTGEPTLQSSVSQYGVTWTFDAEYPVGRFVTGDWWVVGPVTIVSVSPAPVEGRNGSMLDPVGEQDYDSRGGAYAPGLRVAFPLELAGTHSLVSSISHPETPECKDGSTDGWMTYDGDCQRGPIHTQAILTVVAEPPPADAFRPPYAGAAKPIRRASEICWSALPALAAPAEAPAASEILRHVERPWVDHLQSWTMQRGCATHNMFCYGREIGDVVSTVAAYVLLDTPDQRELARRVIQVGIDNFGVLAAGGGWGVDGGHFNGRKFPIVFAGALLGDPEMSSPGQVGNEDGMTYVGAGGIPRWGRVCDSCYLGNDCMYGGNCPNGPKDCRDPAMSIDGCADYRNCCTSPVWVGEALAIRALDRMTEWGNDAFFGYVDRWVAGQVPGGGGASNAFVSQMWSLYRNAPPAVTRCR